MGSFRGQRISFRLFGTAKKWVPFAFLIIQFTVAAARPWLAEFAFADSSVRQITFGKGI